MNSRMQKMFKDNTSNTTEAIISLIHNTLTVEEKADLMKRLSSSMEENKLSMEQISKSIDNNLEDNDVSSDDTKEDSQNSEN